LQDPAGEVAAEKILLVGGQGPAGSWIAKVLLEEGVDFVLLDRRPDNSTLAQIVDPQYLPAIKREFEDTGDPAALLRVIERHGITRLIHLAGVKGAGIASTLAAVRTSGGKVAMTAYASGPAGEGEDEARRWFLDHRIPSIGLREVEAYGVGRETLLAGSFTRAIKAAVLDRRFTFPFTGTAALAYAEDVARAFLAAVLAGASTALAGIPRVAEVPVATFIEKLAEVIPESAGRITALGDPIPREILVDERDIEELPGAGVLSPTSVEHGIRRTVNLFRRMADEGRLREDGALG
jgi:nucleoside-diphosphate-sugar epimerase